MPYFLATQSILLLPLVTFGVAQQQSAPQLLQLHSNHWSTHSIDPDINNAKGPMLWLLFQTLRVPIHLFCSTWGRPKKKRMRTGDAQHWQGQLERRNRVVGRLGDAPDNAPQAAHSVAMWVIIPVPVMRSCWCPYLAIYSEEFNSLFTITCMGLNIMCPYRYGEVVDRRLNREVVVALLRHTKGYIHTGGKSRVGLTFLATDASYMSFFFFV